MTAPRDDRDAPRPFPHGRLIALTLVFFLVIMAVVDSFDEQGITWWTGAKALGGSILVLAYFYLVRYPKWRVRNR